jgi:uncharacterized membrane protein (UPF0127 family)
MKRSSAAAVLCLCFSVPTWGNGPKLHSSPEVVRPNFEKRELLVADRKIVVEIADSDEKRSHGLMFVSQLPADQGMLFVFEDERIRSFWMKNTLIPLSIAYINKNMEIIEILDMQPAPLVATRPKSYSSTKKSMYALEMNIGWFKKNKIWPGVRITFADNRREKLRQRREGRRNSTH